MPANGENDQIEECGIQQRTQCFEQPAVTDHIRHFGCAFTSIEQYENDQGGVQQLGEQRAEVVAQPKMPALGQVFPEVIQSNIHKLGAEIGDH